MGGRECWVLVRCRRISVDRVQLLQKHSTAFNHHLSCISMISTRNSTNVVIQLSVLPHYGNNRLLLRRILSSIPRFSVCLSNQYAYATVLSDES